LEDDKKISKAIIFSMLSVQYAVCVCRGMFLYANIDRVWFNGYICAKTM